jgi:hypothetical protein
MTGPYDPAKYLVCTTKQLLAELGALHENAVVAWDRDCATALDPAQLIIGPVPKDQQHLTLAFAVDGLRIFRLVVDDEDPLGIRWTRLDRKEGP